MARTLFEHGVLCSMGTQCRLMKFELASLNDYSQCMLRSTVNRQNTEAVGTGYKYINIAQQYLANLVLGILFKVAAIALVESGNSTDSGDNSDISNIFFAFNLPKLFDDLKSVPANVAKSTEATTSLMRIQRSLAILRIPSHGLKVTQTFSPQPLSTIPFTSITPHRFLAQVRPDREFPEIWFNSSQPPLLVTPECTPGATDGGAAPPPDERTLKLGKSTVLYPTL